MTSRAGPERVDLDCLVRCHPEAPAEIQWAVAQGLGEEVRRRAVEWGRATSEFLALPWAGGVTVILDGGRGTPMTRGSEVTLPVDERVPAALSCLAHELVHAIAGRSPNHLLNEGLAIHVDSTLRLAGPVWPFFELAPDRWVASFIEEGTHAPLTELLPAPTPRFSEAGQKFLVPSYYLEAGSFVGFLWSRYRRSFWATFREGAWTIDGREMASFEDEWIATIGGPLTAAEQKLRDGSIAAFERMLDGIERVAAAAGARPAPR